MFSIFKSWLGFLQPMFGADGLGGSGVTGAMSKAGLAEGTNAATILTAAPNGAGVDFAINGIAFHKADTDNIALTAAAVQADLTTCMYLIMIDAAGAVSSKKGEEVLTADLATFSKRAQLPMCDANKCPLGAIKVVLSGATFTAGTTDLGAAGVTDTYFDFIGGVPTYPQ